MPALDQLPDEILFYIFSYLHVDDLLPLSRTSRRLRDLACDPVLHLHRLHTASSIVSYALTNRPSRSALSPPNAWIWLSKTNVLSKQISRSLTRIRLSHELERRPTDQELVARAILPATCTSYSSAISPALIQSHQAIQKQQLREGLGRKLGRRPSVASLVSLNILPEECARRTVSPTIFAKRRQIVRESLKDGLRAWVQGRGLQAQRKAAEEQEFSERRTVKSLAQRFAAKKLAAELEESTDRIELEKRRVQARWGREAEIARRKEEKRASANGGCSQPTRAHVLGLKRFWEDAISRAAIS